MQLTRAAKRLVAQLDDPDSSVRLNAIFALREHLTPELLPILERRLNDPDDNIRQYATEYYAELNPPDTATRMVAALDDPDSWVRLNAISRSANTSPPSSYPSSNDASTTPTTTSGNTPPSTTPNSTPPTPQPGWSPRSTTPTAGSASTPCSRSANTSPPSSYPSSNDASTTPTTTSAQYATEYYAELNPRGGAGRRGKRRPSRTRDDQEPIRTRDEQPRTGARDDPLPTEARDVERGLESPAGATRHDQATTKSAVDVIVVALSSRAGATPEELCSAAGVDRAMVDRVLDDLRQLGYLAEVERPNGQLGYRAMAPSEHLAAIDSDEGAAASAGLEELANFLAASRAPVGVTPNETLRVRELEVKPPVAALDAGEARNRWLDAFVAEHLAPELADAARMHLPSRRLGLRLADEDGDVIVLDPRGAPIARIAATCASVRDTSEIAGNFLAFGPHWRALTEALEPLADDSEPIAEAGLHRRFPERVEPQWRETAEAASRRLRLDRTFVFAHELRVDVHGFSLTFSPLTSLPGPLELPFTFEYGRNRFAGALRIAAFDLPLPCVWAQVTDLETFALAWSLALASYAELTCAPRRPAAPPQSKQRAASQATGARPRDRGARSAARSQGGGAVTLPAGFRPRGSTARYLASYVAGHRRQLQPGHSHSPEAARNAAAVGITLRASETWVQPHVRGVPADAVLHLSWSGPTWAAYARLDSSESGHASR